MDNARVLLFAASLRRGSFNRKVADLMHKRLQEAGAAVMYIDLADYPMPLYDANLEAEQGIPENGNKMHELFRTHGGIFIASPEYNANVTPLLANVIAWVSRVSDNGGMAAAFGKPVFALGSASPGGFGGYRGLMSLRNMLELQLGARVLPAMVSVPTAHEAFNEDGTLRNERSNALMAKIAAQLTKVAGTGD